MARTGGTAAFVRFPQESLRTTPRLDPEEPRLEP
jgi:hypothetical protein